MKSAVGKELSKISMPVQFNEPISFIQACAHVFMDVRECVCMSERECVCACVCECA
jgi:hypothetical protein